MYGISTYLLDQSTHISANTPCDPGACYTSVSAREGLAVLYNKFCWMLIYQLVDLKKWWCLLLCCWRCISYTCYYYGGSLGTKIYDHPTHDWATTVLQVFVGQLRRIHFPKKRCSLRSSKISWLMILLDNGWFSWWLTVNYARWMENDGLGMANNSWF